MSDFEIGNHTLLHYHGQEKTVEIPEEVMEIGEKAFFDCRSVKKIWIPESVQVIGNGAFANCRNLEEIKLPISLTKIRSNTFCGCHSLKKITLPENLITIGDSAFRYCSSLKEMILPETLKIISNYAFCYCSHLQKITFPESIEVLGKRAFQKCRNLEEIIFKNFPKRIGDRVFYQCTNTQKLITPEYTFHCPEIRYPNPYHADPYYISWLAEMALLKNYSVYEYGFYYPLKYYELTKEKALEEYFQKNSEEIFDYFLSYCSHQTGLFQKLLSIKNIISKKQIDDLIQTFSLLKNKEFYLYLVNYKNENFGFDLENLEL